MYLPSEIFLIMKCSSLFLILLLPSKSDVNIATSAFYCWCLHDMSFSVLPLSIIVGHTEYVFCKHHGLLQSDDLCLLVDIFLIFTLIAFTNIFRFRTILLPFLTCSAHSMLLSSPFLSSFGLSILKNILFFPLYWVAYYISFY